MLPPLDRISTKIIGMLVIFFLIAFGAISMTLVISWQLEGGAAAINDAGSERMRSYHIGDLMAQGLADDGAFLRQAPLLREELRRFDKVLSDLATGDPVRPLSPPRDAEVQRRLDEVSHTWRQTVRPLVVDYLGATGADSRRRVLDRYHAQVERFVGSINDLVLAMEQKYSYNTNLLRTFQITLAVLAVVGTGVLLRFFFVLVIRPVEGLGDGIRRMAGGDLTVRLPVARNDEFGTVARGFNQMAEHLQGVYATLEERVATKTASLAERNQELGLLYEITSFLNEAGSIDDLCHGFIARVRDALGAEGGAVRLYSPGSEELLLTTHVGLSQSFVASEVALRCGDCLCSDVMDGLSGPVAFNVQFPPRGMKLHTCAREGFATASAFTITQNRQRLGVFNLYFRTPRKMSEQEKNLLETLGQHLGVAIENQRLLARERELAVSEERNMLAQELHDSIAQGLAFLNIQVQLLQDSLRHGKVDEALATAGQLREGVQESYDHVRELLVHFRTRASHIDLDSAIVAALEKFEAQTGIATEFDRVGSGLPLPPEDQVQVMHIVQESLSNVRKHARASAVRVRLQRGLGGVTIEIGDNGVGFDPEADPAVLSDRHVGLKIMKERAHRVGGQCLVTSKVGEGTRVTLTLPRQQREAA